jgi:hypothetical protein
MIVGGRTRVTWFSRLARVHRAIKVLDLGACFGKAWHYTSHPQVVVETEPTCGLVYRAQT